jgi:hypothetical protein
MPKKDWVHAPKVAVPADQNYSLVGCSPAEPTSASFWQFKDIPTGLFLTWKLYTFFGNW